MHIILIAKKKQQHHNTEILQRYFKLNRMWVYTICMFIIFVNNSATINIFSVCCWPLLCICLKIVNVSCWCLAILCKVGQWQKYILKYFFFILNTLGISKENDTHPWQHTYSRISWDILVSTLCYFKVTRATS